MSIATAAASARREYFYGCCASQDRGCVLLGYATAAAMASVSVRRDYVCL